MRTKLSEETSEDIPTATLDMWDKFPQSDPRNRDKNDKKTD